jgi:hypothetical protein
LERLRKYYGTVMLGYASNKGYLGHLQKAEPPKQIEAWSHFWSLCLVDYHIDHRQRNSETIYSKVIACVKDGSA